MHARWSLLRALLLGDALATLLANFVLQDLPAYVLCMLALVPLLLFQIRDAGKVPLVPLAVLALAIASGFHWAHTFGIVFPAWILLEELAQVVRARVARLAPGPVA